MGELIRSAPSEGDQDQDFTKGVGRGEFESGRNVKPSRKRPVEHSIALIIISFVTVSVCYADRTNISTAIVDMKEQYGWSDATVGFILSSFYYGYTAVQIPASSLAKIMGGRQLLVMGLLLWSLFTIVTPLACGSFVLLIGCRVAMGLSEGVTLPTIHHLIAVFVKKNLSSSAVAVVTAGCSFGTVAAMYLSPLIIKELSWEYTFYIFGFAGALWAVPLLVIIQNESDDIKDNKVLGSIDTTGELTNNTTEFQTPWVQLLCTKQVWAIIINQWCNSWGFYVLLNWVPLYYFQELNVEIGDQGALLTFPFFAQAVISVAAGMLADHMISVRQYSASSVRALFQVLGMMIPAVSLFCLVYFVMSPGLASLLFTFGLGGNGFTLVGVSVYPHDFAPQYAVVIFSIGSTIGNIAGIVGIWGTGFLLQVTDSWNVIFLVSIFQFVLGAVVWCLIGLGATPLPSLQHPETFTPPTWLIRLLTFFRVPLASKGITK